MGGEAGGADPAAKGSDRRAGETFPDFFIQIRDAGGVTPQGSFEDFVKAAPEHFRRIAEVVDAAGRTFLDRLAHMELKPSSCEMEFGVNVGGEAGIPFITKGTLGAEFKITVKWEPQAVGSRGGPPGH